MTVYVVLNDCPHNFADKRIVGIWTDARKARLFLDRAKRKDPFVHQFYTIETWRTRPTKNA